MTLQLERMPIPRSKQDPLTCAIDQLEDALEGSRYEREWIEGVNAAVIEMGTALRKHMKLADLPKGLFAEVDETRPTLARQIHGLCGDHYDLLVSTIFLHDEIQHAAEVIRAGRDGTGEPGDLPDLETIIQRGERLVADLRQVQDAENKLVLESVTTDIGVGD